MFRIIRSQLYTITHNIGYLYVLGLMTTVFFCMGSSFLEDVDFSQISASALMSQLGYGTIPMGIMIIFIFITAIFWDDTNDKTINYEILYGYKRSTCYFGRFITGFFFSVLVFVIFFGGTIAAFTIINGWGSAIAFKQVLPHFLLCLFPMFRLACILIFVTFITRSSIASAVTGWFLMFAEMITEAFYKEINGMALPSWYMILTSMSAVTDFSNTAMGYENGEDIMIIKAALEPSLVSETIISSLVIGAVFLLGGYLIYRRSDVH